MHPVAFQPVTWTPELGGADEVAAAEVDVVLDAAVDTAGVEVAAREVDVVLLADVDTAAVA